MSHSVFPFPFLLLLAAAVILLFPLPSLSLTQDGLYLLEFRSSIDDPDGALSNWNQRDPTPCNWKGVTCSRQYVTSLDLSDLNLSGPFDPALCLLPRLAFLSLASNYINSSLPAASLRPCISLVYLDLSLNCLVGELPDSLPSLPSLRHLDLSSNNFSGAIPHSFARFPRLENLSLVYNLLNEPIPPFLGNVTTLRQLLLADNPFAPGTIPPALGNLTQLEYLFLRHCNLYGSIPPSLGGLRKIRNLDLSHNYLTGPIPATFTSLSSAFQIELYNNSLSGELPPGLSNLTLLRFFDASTNNLTGPIPPDLFALPLLENLNLQENTLAGTLPPAIPILTKLRDLRLYRNQLSGTIPPDLGKNSPLVFVDLSNNRFSGEIPRGICDMGSLEQLMMLSNSLSGTLPDGLARCSSLIRLRVSNNLLSGEVPPGLWGLPHVDTLDLARNSFTGPISPSITGGTNISKLTLSDNQFSGSIPEGIRALSKLHEFSAGSNRLSGALPAGLGKLGLLEKLGIHNNSLSGELLRDIGAWKRLSDLNLAGNSLTGSIPPELGDLPVLNYLDLSNNDLTGEIPTQLQNLKLNRFNLSNNQLSGKIPPLYANQQYINSLLGNPGLCDELQGLCPVGASGGKNKVSVWVLPSIFALTGLVFLIGMGWLYYRYRTYIKKKKKLEKFRWTSFHKYDFSESDIFDCLYEDNVIGSGASGKVYKAVLSNGEAVAVKKLWAKLSDGEEESASGNRTEEGSFYSEVETLGKIRHKNIVRLWCACTYKDSNLLVYEYMPNGSLGDALHGSKMDVLNWENRYKIALNAAEGLAYLHHDCHPPIIHRDIKSNNILLDADFGARISDFGVAKEFEMNGSKPRTMSMIAGSRGYIAPEYGYTLRVNEKSDIYSFGVVLLELVTGKPPIDDEFGDKDLAKWIISEIDQKGMEHVLDQSLEVSFTEQICKVLDIGLQCTNPIPISRPDMRKVVRMLLEVRSDNKKSKSAKKQQNLSPYYFDDTRELDDAV